MSDHDEPPRKLARIEPDPDAPVPAKVDTSTILVVSSSIPLHQEHELAESSTPVTKQRGQKRDASGYPKSRKGKESSGKNVGRKRRGTRNDEKGDAEQDTATKGPRYPKRLCALLLSFCGTGCSGMQIQPNVRTIEGVLFDALVKAGAVSEDNADDPVNLARAARTDAGVHAAGNVVSLKLITSRPDVPDILSRINEELPPEIRLWQFVRVQNSFNPRTLCDSRKYTYFFPTYLLIPPKPGSTLMRALHKYAQDSDDQAPQNTTHPFWGEVDPSTEAPEDTLRRKRKWRVPPEQVEQLRATATKFLGTHNFHNFTVGKDVKDRSNQRHMKQITISDPAVYGETEWLSVLFHGQSFMLHQRKMMAALVLSCRTGAPPTIIDELYRDPTVLIPKMPSLGLLLEYPIFDTYNAKVTEINKNLDPSHAEYRPPIDFEQFKDQIAAFKQQFIYDNMRKIEDEFGIFDAWIRSVDKYGGDDLLYLNTKGVIPPEAILVKGARRSNPFREKKRFDATAFPTDRDGAVAKQFDEEDESEGEAEKGAPSDMET